MRIMRSGREGGCIIHADTTLTLSARREAYKEKVAIESIRHPRNRFQFVAWTFRQETEVFWVSQKAIKYRVISPDASLLCFSGNWVMCAAINLLFHWPIPGKRRECQRDKEWASRDNPVVSSAEQECKHNCKGQTGKRARKKSLGEAMIE